MLAGHAAVAPARDVDVLQQSQRGNHLRARFGGEGRPVLLLGHFDTVWPVGTLERMPLRARRRRLYGPGIFDMKAGIAMALIAVARARRDRDAAMPPITMLWTTDEEIGSGTSRDDDRGGSAASPRRCWCSNRRCPAAR